MLPCQIDNQLFQSSLGGNRYVSVENLIQIIFDSFLVRLHSDAQSHFRIKYWFLSDVVCTLFIQ
jgi:hypothetical protein